MTGWPVVPLAELVSVRSGSTPSRAEPANWDGAVPWVSPKDMKVDRISASSEHLSESLVRDGRIELVPPGAVLIVVRGMILARAVPVARTEVGVAINQDMKALIAASRLDPEFLALVLKAREGELLRKVTTAAHGTKKLDTALLLGLGVPLPSPEEQRRIVDLLSRAAGIRRLREEALVKARAVAPALFADLFGDFAGGPVRYPVRELEAVAEIRSGITKGRKLNGEPTVDVPYLRVANVQDDLLDLSEIKTIPATAREVERYALRPGDLLLTEGGDPDKLGRGAVWTGEVPGCLHQNHVFRVRPDTDVVQPDYLASVVGSAYGKAYFLKVAKRTTGIASINRTQLGAFPVPAAPIGAQRQFAERLADLRSIIAQAERALAGTRDLERSLMAQLLG